ncbi:MAG: DUF885 family protein, partial [Gammaproteobacteria bacterium]|nr:DUF885 family protein [Gammaproteobacteria bacterium]
MKSPSRYVLIAAAVWVAGFAIAPVALAADTPAAALDRSQAESQRLHAYFDEYFEAYLRQNPILATSIGDPRYNDLFVVDIAPASIAAEQKLQRDALAKIQTFDRSVLPLQDQLSYDIFKSARERDIAGFAFPDELIPLNQFYSTPNMFVQLGSGNGMQPFKTVQDYDNFLQRLDGFVAWSDQAIVNMREGVKRGYTLPRLLAERTLPQLQAQVVTKPEDSLFWGPITNLPASFSTADKERLTQAYRAAIEMKVVPTYRKLHDFMRDEYIPKARTTHGMQGLPSGDAWYAYNVKRITTTNYTPAQIHQIGLDEVKRI